MLLHLQEEDWPYWELSVVSSMDLPPPVHIAPYAIYLKVILKSFIDNILWGEYEQNAEKDLAKDETSPTEIGVNSDGTWQKRYGYNSLLGATFIISIDNALSIEWLCSWLYSVKSKTYALCKQSILVTVIHDSSYITGAFSSRVTPDTFIPTVKKNKISGTEISFILDDRVKLVCIFRRFFKQVT